MKRIFLATAAATAFARSAASYFKMVATSASASAAASAASHLEDEQ